MAQSPNITQLIAEWQAGSKSAEEALFEAIYRELQRIAVQILRNEKPGQTLGATALVHEAYVRLSRSEELKVTNRTHLLALCARVMRRIVVDRARARMAAKHSGIAVDPDTALVATDREADQILAVDLALAELSQIAPRQCKLVELRYFAGYTIEESALILGVSSRTARREWEIARTRLREIIDGSARAD